MTDHANTAGDDRIRLRLAHSPDPDDAFMWWPLFALNDKPPRLETGRYHFEPVMQDIESLNRRAEHAELEITALSCAQYARVAEHYAITACGASMGDRYGPKLVSSVPMNIEQLRAACTQGEIVIAVPGRRTSAFAVLSMLLGLDSFQSEEVDFKAIIDLVASGQYQAGLIIHEGQLTYAEAGLHLIEDMGRWWHEQTAQPLPLGVNAIRRDLETMQGPGTLAEVTALLEQSVAFAMEHRDESVAYALQWARGMRRGQAGEFIDLYVNRWTLRFGDDGERAVSEFLRRAAAVGVVPPVEQIDFIQPMVV